MVNELMSWEQYNVYWMVIAYVSCCRCAVSGKQIYKNNLSDLKDSHNRVSNWSLGQVVMAFNCSNFGIRTWTSLTDELEYHWSSQRYVILNEPTVCYDASPEH